MLLVRDSNGIAQAEDQALAMVSIWKACTHRKYDELVDPLLSEIRNLRRERTHFTT